MAFKVIDEGTGLLVSLTGFTAPYEFLEVANATLEHPGKAGHAYHIFDFSGIDNDSLFALTDAIGASYAERSREIFGDCRTTWLTALVSPHGTMQVVFDAFIAARPRPEGHELGRFLTLPRAREWLRGRLGG